MMGIVEDIQALQDENDMLHATLADVREALATVLTIVDGLLGKHTHPSSPPTVAPSPSSYDSEQPQWEVIPPFDDDDDDDESYEEEEGESRYTITHELDDNAPTEARYKVDVSDFLGGL